MKRDRYNSLPLPFGGQGHARHIAGLKSGGVYPWTLISLPPASAIQCGRRAERDGRLEYDLRRTSILGFPELCSWFLSMQALRAKLRHCKIYTPRLISLHACPVRTSISPTAPKAIPPDLCFRLIPIAYFLQDTTSRKNFVEQGCPDDGSEPSWSRVQARDIVLVSRCLFSIIPLEGSQCVQDMFLSRGM